MTHLCSFLVLQGNVGVMMRSWKVVASLLGFWLIILLYMSMNLFQADNSERAERQLVQAIGELDVLKSQNEELKKLAVELK